MWSVGAITIGIGILTALLVLPLFWWMCTNVIVGVASILLLLVCETIYVVMPALRLGILLYPQDFVFALLALAAVLRFLTVRTVRDIPKALIVLFVLLFMNFAIGVVRFGTMAGVEFRPYFYTIVGTLYVMSFPAKSDTYRRLFHAWIIASLLVCGVACYRWGMIALGLESYAWMDTTGIEGRVINSGQALVLTIAVVATLFGLLQGTVAKGWVTVLPVLLVVIVGSQQRTVWVTTAASVILVFALAGRGRGRILVTLGIVGTLGLAVLYPLATGGHLDTAASSIQTTAAAGLSTRSGTFVGRMAAWKEHIKDFSSWNPLYQVVGKQFGGGYSVWIGTQEFGNAPHDYYIQTMLRAGLLGVGALVATYGFLLFRLFSTAGPMEGAAKVLWVSVAVEMIYSITYSPQFAQSILYGAALAIATQVPKSSQPAGQTSKT